MKKMIPSLMVAALLCAASMAAQAEYPDKTIRLVVPFAPGGSASSSGRLLAEKLSAVLGQQVYVENIGGANGAIGASTVVRAAADGYTLFYSSAGIMTVNPSLYKKLTYAVKDFDPVSLSSTFSSVLFVNAAFPAKDIPELVAYAKAHPGEVTFGSAGHGSSGHLWGEVLKARAGIDIRHIPYKGTSPALVDVMGGQLTFIVDAAVLGMQHVKSGKLRALGATSTKRLETAPDVQTFSEQGLAGFERLSWYGVFAPVGTPTDIVNTLNKAIVKVAASPDYRQELKALGMNASATSPEGLRSQVRDESDYWGKVLRDAGVSLD